MHSDKWNLSKAVQRTCWFENFCHTLLEYTGIGGCIGSWFLEELEELEGCQLEFQYTVLSSGLFHLKMGFGRNSSEVRDGEG